MSEILPPPEVLYARIREQTKGQKLPQALAKKFSARIAKEFLWFFALSKSSNVWEHSVSALQRISETVKEDDMFDLRYEGADAIKDADLILENHQGPREGNPGTGGIETLLSWKILPKETRFVLKNELIQPQTWNPKKLIPAKVIQKGDPIAVHRPDRQKEGIRRYAKLFREEHRRVFDFVFDSIEKKKPVIVYPEGQRSVDGTIQPFMRDLFEDIYTKYVLPKSERGEEPKIGLIVADTLQVFPEGFGSKVPMYKRPLTMRGMKYDCGPLLEEAKKDPTPRKLGKWFCEDVRKCIRDELSGILLASLA